MAGATRTRVVCPIEAWWDECVGGNRTSGRADIRDPRSPHQPWALRRSTARAPVGSGVCPYSPHIVSVPLLFRRSRSRHRRDVRPPGRSQRTAIARFSVAAGGARRSGFLGVAVASHSPASTRSFGAFHINERRSDHVGREQAGCGTGAAGGGKGEEEGQGRFHVLHQGSGGRRLAQQPAAQAGGSVSRHLGLLPAGGARPGLLVAVARQHGQRAALLPDAGAELCLQGHLQADVFGWRRQGQAVLAFLRGQSGQRWCSRRHLAPGGASGVVDNSRGAGEATGGDDSRLTSGVSSIQRSRRLYREDLQERRPGRSVPGVRREHPGHYCVSRGVLRLFRHRESDAAA
eukprot:ctg_1101.g369